jgi:cytoplasmic iron level regulating protein YaaA (DUF328/UPF0246 family)
VLILLPPSEGKASPSRGRPLDLGAISFPSLTDAREQVLAALVDLCSGDPDRAGEVLGLGATQTAEVGRNAALRTAPTARAERVYTGVLYDALGLPDLDAPARRRAARRVAITSALFGLLRPGDRIPAYRLSGGVTLPGLGAVAAHWRAASDPAVREAAGDGLVVDLRSTTYAGFWRPDPDQARRTASVRVLQQVGTRRTVVSHFNKATKGRLVRALLQDDRTPGTAEELAEQVLDLGWKVETAAPSRTGTRLDVVVEDL